MRQIDCVRVGTGLDGAAWPDEVDVLPWHDTRIKLYCAAKFSEPGQPDSPIWQAIQRLEKPAQEGMLALMRNPINLKLQCDLYRDDGGRLAGVGADVNPSLFAGEVAHLDAGVVLRRSGHGAMTSGPAFRP